VYGHIMIVVSSRQVLMTCEIHDQNDDLHDQNDKSFK